MLSKSRLLRARRLPNARISIAVSASSMPRRHPLWLFARPCNSNSRLNWTLALGRFPARAQDWDQDREALDQEPNGVVCHPSICHRNMSQLTCLRHSQQERNAHFHSQRNKRRERFLPWRLLLSLLLQSSPRRLLLPLVLLPWLLFLQSDPSCLLPLFQLPPTRTLPKRRRIPCHCPCPLLYPQLHLQLHLLSLSLWRQQRQLSAPRPNGRCSLRVAVGVISPLCPSCSTHPESARYLSSRPHLTHLAPLSSVSRLRQRRRPRKRSQ